MGLDAVEMVMAVEEAFDITLDDAEVEKLLTPGALIDCVMSKVGRTDRAACLTQRAFHQLRAALMRQCGLKRNQIRPETPLAELFPQPGRKERVQKILTELNISNSIRFGRPVWMRWAILGVAGGFGIATGLAVENFPITTSFTLVNFFTAVSPELSGLAATVMATWLCVRLTRRYRSEFELRDKTLAGLSRWVMAHAPSLVQSPPGQWSREQAAEKVKTIVMDFLGCSEKQYREDARFIEDLGMD